MPLASLAIHGWNTCVRLRKKQAGKARWCLGMERTRAAGPTGRAQASAGRGLAWNGQGSREHRKNAVLAGKGGLCGDPGSKGGRGPEVLLSLLRR